MKLLGTAVIGVRGGCGACVRWIKGGREVEKETKRGKNEGGREREREQPRRKFIIIKNQTT